MADQVQDDESTFWRRLRAIAPIIDAIVRVITLPWER